MQRRLLSTTRSILLFSALLTTCLAQGATVLRVSSQDLVDQAELIFEGEVTGRRTVMNPAGYIHTWVEFRVVDMIKGNIPVGQPLELRFTGGQVGQVRMDAGVRIPRVGEHGIYFVEQAAPGLINPLLGWEQGRFTITEDGTVVAGDERTVQEVSPQNRPPLREISQGVAYGVDTTEPTASSQASEISNSPLSVEEFKRSIRGMMQ